MGLDEPPCAYRPASRGQRAASEALLAGAGQGWLSPGATGAPQIANFPSALAALVLGNNLAGAHLVGLLAALATVVASYLLAIELFWISPQRLGGILAGGFTAGAVALFHFGRLATYLPPTAVGVCAAWALLAGQRKLNLPLLAVSGILAAGALGWIVAGCSLRRCCCCGGWAYGCKNHSPGAILPYGW